MTAAFTPSSWPAVGTARRGRASRRGRNWTLRRPTGGHGRMSARAGIWRYRGSGSNTASCPAAPERAALASSPRPSGCFVRGRSIPMARSPIKGLQIASGDRAMPFDISIWIICGAVLLLAGFVKGVIGLGLPTISVGLLGLVMTPLQAAALLVIPNLVTNIWQLAIGEPVMALVKRLWPTLAGIVLGTLIGALALPAETSRWAVTALGIILALYALIGLSAVHLQVSPARERWAG
eukprot:gene37694-50888_t